MDQQFSIRDHREEISMMSVISNTDHFPPISAYRLEEPRRLKTSGVLKSALILLSIQLQDSTLLWAAIASILSHEKCRDFFVNKWRKKQQSDSYRPSYSFRPNMPLRQAVAKQLLRRRIVGSHLLRPTPAIDANLSEPPDAHVKTKNQACVISTKRGKLKPGMIIPIRALYEALHASPTSEFWDMDWCSPQPISQPTPTKCVCIWCTEKKRRNRRMRKTQKDPNL